MTEDERIEQFRKMAKANPDDDLAHFALGQALHDAGRHAEAAIVLKHVLKLNDGYSKAYVLLGLSLDATGDADGAVETWQAGHPRAQQRGDLAVALEIESLLRARGVEPPKAERAEVEPADDREPGEGEVRDRRTGRIGPQMRFNPFPGPVGDFIVANVSQESWDAWRSSTSCGSTSATPRPRRSTTRTCATSSTCPPSSSKTRADPQLSPSPRRSRNSASVRTVTPASFAFCSLLPALPSSPTTR
jgi:tetratricopeptide (TPR) repeat protein